MKRLCSVFAAMAMAMASVAHAQTIPALTPEEAELGRCFNGLRADPAGSEGIARRLLAREGLSPRVEIRATICLALAQQVQGKRDGVAEAVDAAEAILASDRLPEDERTPALLSVGPLLQYIGRSEASLARMNEAHDLAVRRDDVRGQIGALLAIGHLHAMELGDLERALSYFRRVLDRTHPQTREHVDARYAHAYTLLRVERHDEARPELERLLSQASLHPDRGLVPRVRSHLAEIQRVQGDVDGARAVFEEVAAEQQRLADAAGEGVTRLRLARLHLDAGALAPAREQAERALALVDGGGFETELMDALVLLSTIHEAAGDPAAALPLLRRERELAAARMARRNQGPLATLDARAEAAAARPGEAGRATPAGAAPPRGMVWAALIAAILLGAGLAAYQRRVNRRLLRLSTIDPLTGLPNRREMLRRIAALPAQEGAARATLFLVDVDHFKAINTRYGHAEGDAVLAAVAGWLADACDADDMVARWGGEEFLIVRPAATPEGAARFAEHLRAGVRDGSVPLPDGRRVSATVSVGAAPVPFFPEAEASTWQTSVRIADAALRAVKRSGRDGWALVWGQAGARGATAMLVEQDPAHAVEQDWVRVLSSRTLQWPVRGAREEAAAPALE
ncbi:diguanylate cyclase [Coralloluteibacterium thermophilus]|uniref:diguanylate cyclase n=1 Tax=Coralloluteibacterium thermophilum TaxID=2707049 RepID=A0ABV9NGX6_9GAMM